MKKILPLALLMLILLCLAPGGIAEILNSGNCGDNVTWAVDDTGTLTISGTGPMKDYAEYKEGEGTWLYSPPYWDWDKSVSIEESRRKITRVVIENGVTTIGGGALRDLDGLVRVEIADSVKSIGIWAFDKDVSLPEVTIPSGVTVIPDSAFSDCHALASVTLPTGVTRIEDWAFYNTGMTSIDIPASVREIGTRVFYESPNMVNVNVASGNTAYKSIDGVLFTKDGAEMIYYGAGRKAAVYAVPDGVRLLHPSTFSYTSALKTVELPESLEEIRDWAFGHTGLQSVIVPPHVTKLGYCAFGACEALTTVTLPASLADVSPSIFSGCHLKDIYFQGTAAQWTALGLEQEMLLGATIHFADGSVDDSLADIVALGTCGSDLYWKLNEDGVLTISGTGAMDTYARTTTTHYDAWGRPSYTESYYTYPWRDVSDKIRAVMVEEGVTTLGNMAFAEIGTLRLACLPLSLKTVVAAAFYKTGLTDVYYAGTQAQWANVGRGQNNAPLTNATFHWSTTDMPLPDVIYWSVQDGTLTVWGRGAMENFAGSPPWWSWDSEMSEEENRRAIRRIVVREGVTAICDWAFNGLESVESVEIAPTVARIGAWAFYGDTALPTVYIPSSVTEIGLRAFYECTAMKAFEVSSDNPAYKSVGGALFTKDGREMISYGAGHTASSYAIPAGVKVLHPSTFSYTEALQEVILPDSLIEIGDWAFGHTGLTSVIVPDGVKSLPYCVFGSCTALTKATLPASLTQIGKRLFGECPLKDVYYEGTEAQWQEISIAEDNDDLLGATIHYQSAVTAEEKPLRLPANLTEIQASAFEGGAFTHVYLGGKVTKIGAKAFANCGALAYIEMPAGVTDIAPDAFDGSANVTIACVEGSAAQQYAAERGIKYRLMVQ